MKIVVSEYASAEQEEVNAPAVRMPGGNYQAKFAQWGLTLSLARVKVRGDDVSGLLTVDVGAAHPGGVIWRGSINLAAGQSRKALAKLLGERMNGHYDPPIPFGDIIENLAIRVLGAEELPLDILTLGELGEPEALSYLLHPLVVEGHAQIVFGPPDSAKSYLALAICLSIESGIEVIPGFVPRKGRTLYLDWESLASVADRRWRQLAHGAGIDPPPMRYVECRQPLASIASKLAVALAGNPADLIVVDSAGLAAGLGSERGDPAETTLRLHATLRELGRTALIIDHTAKADRNADRPATPYGSQYKTALVRHGFEIRASATGAKTHVGLYHAKHSLMAPLDPLGLVFDFGVPGYVSVTRETIIDELTMGLPLHERIFRILAGRHLEPKEISEEIDEPSNKVRSVLSRYSGTMFNRLASGKWEALPR